jgi:hypothetical protein
MATTKLTLYNGSLGKIKHRKLATLTDNTKARYLLDDEYDKTIAWCLEQGLWNFALRTLAIEASVDVESEFGPTGAFERPEDYVRLNAISANGHFNPTYNDYIDEGEYWLASVNPLYVSYVSNDTSYGLNLAKWPATFVSAVEYELAFRVAPHLTAMSDNESTRLEVRRNAAMRDARAKDALNQPAQRPPPGRLVMSRVGGTGRGQSPWWR